MTTHDAQPHLLAHAHGDHQVGDEHDAVGDDHDERDDRAAHRQVLGQGDALPVNQAVEARRVGAFRAEDAGANEACMRCVEGVWVHGR